MTFGWRFRSHRGSDRVTLGLLVAFVALVGNVVFSALTMGRLDQTIRSLQTREVASFDAAWRVRFLDEALTHSISQYVLTSGDGSWKQRYDGFVGQLDETLRELGKTGDPRALGALAKVSTANNALVDLETKAFASVDARDRAKASQLLAGPYVQEKLRYQKGLDAFFEYQRASIERSATRAQRFASWLRFVTLTVGVFLSIALFTLGRVYRRQALLIDANIVARDVDDANHRFEARLTRALDMAQMEEQALETVGAILETELPHGPAELLLADSSQAHLRQVVTTDTQAGRPGCGVASPRQCPAIRASASMLFSDPTSYDACPHLRERKVGGCIALCAPLSIRGSTVGVLHALVPTTQNAERALSIAERIGVRTGERLGVLQAFATSQLQAATDPLTGLLNRRSLETSATEMLNSSGSVMVMFFDLDHFKTINDTHGHETGDRCLRQFSKIMRDCTRSTDLVGRWGGEEFVVVLGNGSPEMAAKLFQRIQESAVLAGTLGTSPTLTTSVGIATHIHGETFGDTVRRADEALLCAKANGRDRLEFATHEFASNRPSL